MNEKIEFFPNEHFMTMLKRGKLTIDEIAKDSGLSVAEVEQLKEQLPELLTV